MDNMEFTGERFIPGESSTEMEAEHLQRYNFAQDAVKDLVVLDAACGEGYGSNILCANAKKVYGIDISEEAILYAKEKYPDEKLTFLCASIENIPLPDNSIDCVVSFETIEHVGEELQHKFMAEIKRILRPSGFLLMSTPNKAVYSDMFQQDNHFHMKEFYYQEFIDFIQRYFKNHTVFSQYFEVCANIEKTDIYIANKRSEFDVTNAKYFIALCTDLGLESIVLKSNVLVLENNIYTRQIARILELQAEVEEKNHRSSAEFGRLNQEIDKLGAWGKSLDETIKKYQEEIKECQEKIKLYQKDIDLLEDRLNYTEEKFNNMKLQKEQYEQLYSDYKRELENVLASRSFKLVKKLSGFRVKVLPPNSKRTKFAKKILRALRLSNNVAMYARPKMSFERLFVPVFPRPKVSIIIPVYNHFDYTYNCIKSIIENTNEIEYEIILADDNSSDRTKKAGNYFQNAVIVRNKTNLGFLRNCNNAVKSAKGDYIHFLNNDTMVKGGWLIPLVYSLDHHQEIGLVGSKLLNADGSLQEAGGIIWGDASGWNFGLGQDPSLPEFNYLKEVDYISGASIMIRRSLWEEIGGFDERYVPAYFEDSDLAFEVRKHGYKVVYQPMSQVVHFEGISNGRDESVGIKSYQTVNREKFIAKWKDILEAEHFNNGETVFYARDRSKHKKTILVVDHYVPFFDQDAGSRAIFGYLNLFLDMGLNVKFIGDNYFKHEPYTKVLEQLGIEVLYGPKYSPENWKDWVFENRDYLNYVMLSRPHISEKYIDFIKDSTHAKILYLGHDFHYLREMREYELTQDEKLLESAKEWRVKEYYLMSHADRVLMVSDFEKIEIKKAFNIDVDVIPIYCFDQFMEDRIDFRTKKDLIFVGGFNHRPNLDGLLWFLKEVWPIVLKSLPQVAINIVGSNIPDSLKKMECNNIHIKGFIPDEELTKLYRECRVCIVPLRYGAGIKGKVIEAMYNRISIVTTEVGIEGLTDIRKIIPPTDNSQSFAWKIIEKYNNQEILEKDSLNYNSYLKEHFSYSYAISLFKNLFYSLSV